MFCQQCGEDFDGRQSGQKFCSKKCKAENRRNKERARKGRVERTVECAGCKKVFVTWDSRKRFCSIDCNNYFHRSR